jgi:hypothetical protein
MSREATLLVAHDEIVIIRPVTSFPYDPLTRAYVRRSGRPDDLGAGPAARWQSFAGVVHDEGAAVGWRRIQEGP